MSIIAKSQTLLTEKEFAAYGRAGAIAEEVLSSIRTVVAFGGQKKEVERFEKKVTYDVIVYFGRRYIISYTFT